MTSTTFPWFIANVNPRTGFRCDMLIKQDTHFITHFGYIICLLKWKSEELEALRFTKVKSTFESWQSFIKKEVKTFCRSGFYLDSTVQTKIWQTEAVSSFCFDTWNKNFIWKLFKLPWNAFFNELWLDLNVLHCTLTNQTKTKFENRNCQNRFLSQQKELTEEFIHVKKYQIDLFSAVIHRKLVNEQYRLYKIHPI